MQRRSAQATFLSRGLKDNYRSTLKVVCSMIIAFQKIVQENHATSDMYVNPRDDISTHNLDSLSLQKIILGVLLE